MIRFALISLVAFAVACGGDEKADTDGCGSGCGNPPAKTGDGCGSNDGCGSGAAAAMKTVQLEVTGMS